MREAATLMERHSTRKEAGMMARAKADSVLEGLGRKGGGGGGLWMGSQLRVAEPGGMGGLRGGEKESGVGAVATEVGGDGGDANPMDKGKGFEEGGNGGGRSGEDARDARGEGGSSMVDSVVKVVGDGEDDGEHPTAKTGTAVRSPLLSIAGWRR